MNALGYGRELPSTGPTPSGLVKTLSHGVPWQLGHLALDVRRSPLDRGQARTHGADYESKKENLYFTAKSGTIGTTQWEPPPDPPPRYLALVARRYR